MGWDCTPRAKYDIYDCLVFALAMMIKRKYLRAGDVGFCFKSTSATT